MGCGAAAKTAESRINGAVWTRESTGWVVVAYLILIALLMDADRVPPFAVLSNSLLRINDVVRSFIGS
jgi:hypothetical protein